MIRFTLALSWPPEVFLCPINMIYANKKLSDERMSESFFCRKPVVYFFSGTISIQYPSGSSMK